MTKSTTVFNISPNDTRIQWTTIMIIVYSFVALLTFVTIGLVVYYCYLRRQRKINDQQTSLSSSPPSSLQSGKSKNGTTSKSDDMLALQIDIQRKLLKEQHEDIEDIVKLQTESWIKKKHHN